VKIFIQRVFSVLSILVILAVPQVQAITHDDISCTLSGDAGGTCHYDPTDCTTDSASDITDVTAGSGTPTGLTFPNLDPASMASAIDKWVVKVNPNTKFKGLGATIVADGKHADVNPFFITSIARKESDMSDANDFNVKNANNSFGRTATDRQPHINGSRQWYKWTSVKASVDYKAAENVGAVGGGDIATYMTNVYGEGIKKNDLTSVMEFYAPRGENKTDIYIKDVGDWMGELANLAKDGGAAPDTQPAEETTVSGDSGSGCITDGCQTGAAPKNSDAPTITIDPGHGPKRTVVDSKTNLSMVEQPGGDGDEIGHVWNVSNTVKKDLEAAGYKVLLTKTSENDNLTMRDRANVADGGNSDLAISVHGDQTLKHPGEIYDQKVGLYRGTGSDRTEFTDSSVAKKSQDYASIFKQEREDISGKSVAVLDNKYFDRGIGMEPGNISLVQLFSKTPWVYNEKKMPFDDGDYAKELVASVKKAVPIKESAGGNDAPANPQATADCVANGSGSVQDLVNTAMKYSWSDGSHGTSQKPSYIAALKHAASKGIYFGGARGNDCGGFVTVVMHDSGADPNYNKAKGDTNGQKAYLDAHPKMYKNLGQPTSTKNLQAGDIAINKGHTFIYVGPQSSHPNFHGDQASASYSEVFANSRAPSAETLGVYPGHSSGPFTFYRLIKSGS
jgi:N-acetylmuramoyl-L-alanine amidase